MLCYEAICIILPFQILVNSLWPEQKFYWNFTDISSWKGVIDNKLVQVLARHQIRDKLLTESGLVMSYGDRDLGQH